MKCAGKGGFMIGNISMGSVMKKYEIGWCCGEVDKVVCLRDLNGDFYMCVLRRII